MARHRKPGYKYSLSGGGLRPEQKQALKLLQLAFKFCSDTGLVFIGMDRDLEAYSAERLEDAGYWEPGDPHDAMNKAGRVTVNTDDSYLDSGGY